MYVLVSQRFYVDSYFALTLNLLLSIPQVQYHHGDVSGPVQYPRHRHGLAELRPSHQLFCCDPSLPRSQGGIQ